MLKCCIPEIKAFIFWEWIFKSGYLEKIHINNFNSKHSYSLILF